MKIEPRSEHSYSQEQQTIFLNSTLLQELTDAAYKGMKLELEVKAAHLSSITHELSHAHDHLIKQRGIRPQQQGLFERALDILDTELRAWAREAITAHRISPQQLDPPQRALIDGWRNVTEAMFDKIDASRSNAVMDRLFRYTKREIQPPATSDIQNFLTANKSKLWGDIKKLQDAVVKYTPP